MRFTFFLFLLHVVVFVSAQLPTDFRTEQIYLNPDRHVYLPGDTIELEGQVACIAMERFLPYSRYLYVELFNAKDSLLLRQKVSCKDKGYFNTRFPVAYELPAGVYYLRSYTHFMRNFSPESFAVQPLLVGKQFPNREIPVVEPRCQIALQGGSMATGNLQTLAIYLSDGCTFPISAPLFLINEKGDTLLHTHTSASGLALLHFIPQDNLRYKLAGHADDVAFSFPLPLPSNTPKVQGSINGKRVSYQVQNLEGDLEGYCLYTFDRRNGLVELRPLKPEGIIRLEYEPEVLSIFLTDLDRNLLSECAVVGGRNSFGGLQAPDTLYVGDSLHYDLPLLPDGSRVMARVLPENDLLASHAESTLEYLSDYDSPFPFPLGGYVGDSGLPSDDVQAWLCSARFKRFSLSRLVEQDTAIYLHFPEQAMTFNGWIENSNKHPWKRGTLVAYHTGNDYVYDADIDHSGRFTMVVDDFTEGDSFFLQAVTPKGKPEFAIIHLDEEKYPRFMNVRPFSLPHPRYAKSEWGVEANVEQDYILDKDSVSNYIFPEVTVKARLYVEEPPKETNAFYRTNFTNREKIEERNFLTLYDILQDMPGISIIKNEKGEISLYSSRGMSTLDVEDVLPIIVDNTQVGEKDYHFALEMPAFEIESVELLRPWQTLACITGAINGAILVKTRNCEQGLNAPSKGTIYTPSGLSPYNTPYKKFHWIASQEGIYRLIVDIFTDSDVQSYEHCFKVKKLRP